MHSIQSLAHRAPPAATRARVRWQPYASTTSAILSSCSPSNYLNTPSSSVTSSPSHSTCDIERVQHAPSLPQSQPPVPTPSQSRENPKTKYALGLVDQAVKVLGDIWHPHDIPELFTTTRSTASASLCSDLTVSMVHASIAAPNCTTFGRNTQLPSPTTPSTFHISPLSSHAILSPISTSYRQPQIQIDQAPECRKSLVPVRAFIQEVLKRSKTTGSVLQTALCYLEAIRPQVVELAELEKSGQGIRGEPELGDRIVPGTQADFDLEASLSMDFNLHPPSTVDSQEGSALGSDDSMTKTVIDDHATKKTAPASLGPLPPLPSPLLCPRRAFLASLILASKFMQDKCYSNRAWAKLSGLPPREISRCERALGDALGWRLWVGKTPVPDSTAAAAPPRAIVRSRSDSNLAKSAQGAFLSSAETSSPSSARLLRRCSTLPNNAFVNVEAPPCQGGSSIVTDDRQSGIVSYGTSQYVPDGTLSDSSPPTPGLSYSPSSTSSSGDSTGDKTVQMSFLEDNMAPLGVETSFSMDWSSLQVGGNMAVEPFNFGKGCAIGGAPSNGPSQAPYIVSPPGGIMHGSGYLHSMWTDGHALSRMSDVHGISVG
ncbi:hypothetical protein BDZ89DRAFT_1057002 [Hymenopellis radicata]|nr:hypothetical protein BDZ89DRAFT_1057002 [Hymenopellis radicata]